MRASRDSFAFLCILVTGFELPSAELSLDSIVQTLRSSGGYSCRTLFRKSSKEDNYRAEGRLIATPDRKVRLELNTSYTCPAGTENGKTLIVSDGKRLWVETTTERAVSVVLVRLDAIRQRCGQEAGELYLPIIELTQLLRRLKLLFSFSRSEKDGYALLRGERRKEPVERNSQLYRRLNALYQPLNALNQLTTSLLKMLKPASNFPASMLTERCRQSALALQKARQRIEDALKHIPREGVSEPPEFSRLFEQLDQTMQALKSFGEKNKTAEELPESEAEKMTTLLDTFANALQKPLATIRAERTKLLLIVRRLNEIDQELQNADSIEVLIDPETGLPSRLTLLSAGKEVASLNYSNYLLKKPSDDFSYTPPEGLLINDLTRFILRGIPAVESNK